MNLYLIGPAEGTVLYVVASDQGRADRYKVFGAKQVTLVQSDVRHVGLRDRCCVLFDDEAECSRLGLLEGVRR